MNNCAVCGIEVTGKGKTCSPRCRKILSRQVSVTQNVYVTAPEASVTFRFKVPYRALNETDSTVQQEREQVREAKFWYDVPLGAIPIYEKDWPKKPDFMNGRQYFLWWKNEFKLSDDPKQGQVGVPIILNPFPENKDARYVMGGAESRIWSGR